MANDMTVTSADFYGLLKTMATDEKVDPAKMQAILDVQERMMNKAAEQAFNDAMLRIDNDLPRLVRNTPVAYKDKETGKMKTAFKYIKYEEVDDHLRPLLRREGLRISFTTQQRAGEGGGAVVTARLTHEKGHSIEASMNAGLDTSGGKSNLQGMGSTISYCRRVLTCMLFNIVTMDEDTDGVVENYIQAEQAKEIRDLIEKKGVVIDTFLKWAGCESIEKMLSSKYKQAKTMLLQKKDVKNDNP